MKFSSPGMLTAEREPTENIPISSTDQTDHLRGHWSEELLVVTRLEIYEGSLAVCLRSGRWIRLLPTGADSFDAEVGGFALQFTRNAAAEVTEVKASGTRVRNLRHTRVVMPKT